MRKHTSPHHHWNPPSLSCPPPKRWSCPSLTAAEVKSVAEMEAYRLFSETICTELEDTATGSSACPPPPTAARTRTGFTLGKPSEKPRNMDIPDRANISGNQGDADKIPGEKKGSETNQRNVEGERSEGVKSRPRATEKRRSAAAAVRRRTEVEAKYGDDNSSGDPNTFLTALKRSESAVQLRDLAQGHENIVDGGSSSDCQQREKGGGDDRDALYDAQGLIGRDSNSSLVRKSGKRKIDIILSAASREFMSPGGVDVDPVAARKGRGRRGRGRRPSMDCLEMQRSALRSAR